MGMTTTTRTQFAIYSLNNSEWTRIEGCDTAEDAARRLGAYVDGNNQFSPPVDQFAADLAAGYAVQASDRIGTRYVAVDHAGWLHPVIQASATQALIFGHTRPEDESPFCTCDDPDEYWGNITKTFYCYQCGKDLAPEQTLVEQDAEIHARDLVNEHFDNTIWDRD